MERWSFSMLGRPCPEGPRPARIDMLSWMKNHCDNEWDQNGETWEFRLATANPSAHWSWSYS